MRSIDAIRRRARVPRGNYYLVKATAAPRALCATKPALSRRQ